MFELPVVVKASTDAGKRMVELQVSSEDVDLEGDVILQSALLNSAESFVKNGHLDIDHYSELGHRLNPPIPNPASYIVGNPVEVKDLGHGRTGVVGQISASKDGSFDPEHNQYDMLWKSLTSDPPVKWRASIYGFPLADSVEDCSETRCSHGATRFLVKGLDWRSLAFTRNPVNNSITGFARVITAKSFIAELYKSGQVSGQAPSTGKAGQFPQDQLFASIGDVGAVISGADPKSPQMNCPENLDEMWGEYTRHMLRDCGSRNPLIGNSIPFFRDHYMTCRGLPFDKADILAHALMYLVQKERKRNFK
ncbi:MAG: hypothetical protein ACYCOR_21035 [Acidobacteriaceae bacterium]